MHLARSIVRFHDPLKHWQLAASPAFGTPLGNVGFAAVRRRRRYIARRLPGSSRRRVRCVRQSDTGRAGRSPQQLINAYGRPLARSAPWRAGLLMEACSVLPDTQQAGDNVTSLSAAAKLRNARLHRPLLLFRASLPRHQRADSRGAGRPDPLSLPRAQNSVRVRLWRSKFHQCLAIRRRLQNHPRRQRNMTQIISYFTVLACRTPKLVDLDWPRFRDYRLMSVTAAAFGRNRSLLLRGRRLRAVRPATTYGQIPSGNQLPIRQIVPIRNGIGSGQEVADAVNGSLSRQDAPAVTTSASADDFWSARPISTMAACRHRHLMQFQRPKRFSVGATVLIPESWQPASTTARVRPPRLHAVVYSAEGRRRPGRRPRGGMRRWEDTRLLEYLRWAMRHIARVTVHAATAGARFRTFFAAPEAGDSCLMSRR